MPQQCPERRPSFRFSHQVEKTNSCIKGADDKERTDLRNKKRAGRVVSHQHGRDGILDVAIGGSPQQLPEAALRQLHRAFLLLL